MQKPVKMCIVLIIVLVYSVEAYAAYTEEQIDFFDWFMSRPIANAEHVDMIRLLGFNHTDVAQREDTTL